MADEDASFLDDITPGVMKHLEECKFFESLDAMFAPVDPTLQPRKCANSFAASTEILKASGLEDDYIEDVFEVLRSRGGFCDCEVLYNAAPESNLRAAYWKRHAAEMDVDADPHSEQ